MEQHPCEGEAKGEVLLVHGANEHVGRYGHLVAGLNEAGFSVTAVDLRGHGKSYGKRGHVLAWSDYCDDVRTAAGVAGKPVFVIAHSMGGLVALDTLRAPGFDVRGVVLSNPLLGLAFTPPKAKTFGAKLLSRVVPALSLGNEVVVEHTSRDPAAQEAYRRDPLISKTLTPRWFVEMQEARARVAGAVSSIGFPLLMLLGTGDKITCPNTAKEVFGSYGGDDKKIVSYEGLYHEILNEPERDQVVADIVEWLKARTK